MSNAMEYQCFALDADILSFTPEANLQIERYTLAENQVPGKWAEER